MNVAPVPQRPSQVGETSATHRGRARTRDLKTTPFLSLRSKKRSAQTPPTSSATAGTGATLAPVMSNGHIIGYSYVPSDLPLPVGAGGEVELLHLQHHRQQFEQQGHSWPQPLIPTSNFIPSRTGYWNRRGDTLDPLGHVIPASESRAYPKDLASYPEHQFMNEVGELMSPVSGVERILMWQSLLKK